MRDSKNDSKTKETLNALCVWYILTVLQKYHKNPSQTYFPKRSQKEKNIQHLFLILIGKEKSNTMSILKLKATIKTYVQKIADIYKHGYDYDVSVHVLLFVQGILIELFIYNLENCDMLLDISIPFFK